MGTAMKRTIRQTPGFYKVATTQTITAGGNVTFDLSNLSRVLSDAGKNGKTAMVHTMSIVINHAGTYAASGAGNAATCADIQRLCFYQANFQLPNLSSQLFLKDPRLAFARQIGLVVNPGSVMVDRLLSAKKRQFQRTDTDDTAPPTTLVVPSSDVDKRINLLTGWRDDENWQFVSTVGASAFEFSDVCTIPLCAFSGNFANDRLPLSMVCDPSNPWKLTVSEVTAGGGDIRTDLFKTTAHTITCELWLYVSFVDSTSPLSVGTIWTCAPNSFTSNSTIPPHFYRGIFQVPDYNNAQKDGALTQNVPYKPANFQANIEAMNLRIFDCTEQRFPLDSLSEGSRTIDHANIGASQGCNPEFLYRPDDTTTLIAGPSTTLAGTNPATWYSAEAIGMWSSCPFMPLLINHLGIHGFPINVMAEPGCQADYRITVDGTALPAGDVFYIYVGEYRDDRRTALGYAVLGKQDKVYNDSTWQPLLDNPTSPEAVEASRIVPAILRR